MLGDGLDTAPPKCADSVSALNLPANFRTSVLHLKKKTLDGAAALKHQTAKQ